MKKVFLALAAALAVGIVAAAASPSISSSPVKKPGVFKTRAISFLAADGSRGPAAPTAGTAKRVLNSVILSLEVCRTESGCRA